jgi:hypothetical protein
MQSVKISLLLALQATDPWAHACTILAGITIKLFMQAGKSIKTFDKPKIEELNCARECPRFYLQSLERYDVLCCPVFQVFIF